MTYAVVLSADDGPEQAGRLDLEDDGLRFSGGSRVRYADLRDVYFERRATGGRSTALVLVSRDGERLRISSLQGLGVLHELAEELVGAREGCGKTAA